MSSPFTSNRAPTLPRHRWLPRHHGAWAMLLLPLLVGVAVSRPDSWQLVLGGAALSGYLLSATVEAWARGRRHPGYRVPILVYGGAFAVLGLSLVATFPALLLVLAIVAPAGAIVLGGAQPGTRRDLVNSLAQVAEALVLVPAAAYVSGDFELDRVITGTAIAAGYLLGTVLVVRSVLRERGNDTFAAVSVGFHIGLAVGAVVLLPAVVGWLAVALAGRAVALPVLQRRLAGSRRPLRPLHVGLVELAASLAVVLASFAAPL